MHRLILASCATLTLAACVSMPTQGSGPGYVAPVVASPGSAPPADPLARSAAYTCEDLTTIVLTEGQRDARATLNSGLELNLARQGAGRYGAPPYEFRAGGSDGSWLNQGRVWRCRVR